MPSYYDEKAKCRVGEMDEGQFYAECDKDNGLFFKTLISTWNKASGSLKWGAGGVGLRAALPGAGGKEVGLCFLAPKFAGKQDRVELACATLTKQIGEAAVKKLHTGLRKAAEGSFKGTSMVSLINPGQLSAQAQKAIMEVLLAVVKG